MGRAELDACMDSEGCTAEVHLSTCPRRQKPVPRSRFLGSGEPDPNQLPEFTALGHAGSKEFNGLEVFPNPGVTTVVMTSDEFTAVCPITEQPDYYTMELAYAPDEYCIESKSLKLFLNSFRNHGAFVERLAVDLRDAFGQVLEVSEDKVQVTLTQKSRGGITIRAMA